MAAGLTPSQTIGPFYWGTIVKAYRADLAPPGVAGERIEVVLTLHDVEGAIVPDGLLELWQANSHGRYNHPEDRRNLPLDAGFDGFGRASTDTEGCAHFSTVKPGRVPWPAGRHAGAAHQHLDLRPRPAQSAGDAALFRRRSGLRRGSGAEDGRSGAPRHPARQADDKGVWRLPIHLGGAHETVFFDC